MQTSVGLKDDLPRIPSTLALSFSYSNGSSVFKSLNSTGPNMNGRESLDLSALSKPALSSRSKTSSSS